MRATAGRRDWLLQGRLWEGVVWLILVAIMSMIAREAWGAEACAPDASRSSRS